MPFDFSKRFDSALKYTDFLDAHGTPSDQHKWQGVFDSVHLSDAQTQLLKGFKREMNVLCMAGAWCGDCVKQCPIFHQFEKVSSKVQVRFLDRDADPELAGELKVCGGSRVPQVVFLSEENKLVGRYGDRTLSAYRRMASQLSGAACSTGLMAEGDSGLAAVVQDWLNEFERIQLILRTSPGLRRIHGD